MMTNEQYERWKDFALCMARTCFSHLRMRPSKAWVIEQVESFFDGLDPNDIPCLVDWDSSDNYPPDSPYYRKAFRTYCWHCSKPGADKSACRYSCEDGMIYDYAHPDGVGDMMTGHFDDERGYAPRCRACSQSRWGEDYNESLECQCDEIQDHYYYQWDDQWGGPVRCCIRAGLDFASAPSAGVLGFTVGDLRRMYPEGVPEWISGGDEKWCPWLREHDESECHTLAEMPDSMGIVL